MTFCFDIDGVLFARAPDNDYRRATPQPAAVALVNSLHDLGHTIVLWTARGSKTGIDWRELTIAQLAASGVRYHELRFGKPAADFYIDDRSLPLEALADLVAAGALAPISPAPSVDET